MDTYTLSITLPRGAGNHAFIPDATPPSASCETALDDLSGRNAPPDRPTTSPQQQRQRTSSQTQPQEQDQQQSQEQASQPQTSQSLHPFAGRLGSMRSRFPPSVKAFMPSAFGGKRASERIAEVSSDDNQDEAHDSNTTTSVDRFVRSTASDWRKSSRLKSTSSLPLSVPEEGPASVRTGEDAPANIRDSRSTAGTRSSLDFSSAASFSADSTAPSTAANTTFRDSGSRHEGGKSDPPSVSHSASASITTLGAQHPLTTGELAEAAQRLTTDVTSATQALVSCTPVREETSSNSHAQATLARGGSGAPGSSMYSPYLGQVQQLPYPSSNHPYQHYAQGFGQEMGVTSGASGFPQPFPSMSTRSFPSTLGNPAALSSASLASSMSHQPLPPPPQIDSKPKMPRYNFLMTGTFQQVMDSRGAILRQHPFRSRVTVKVPKADILESTSSNSPSLSNDSIKPHVRLRLDEIAASTETHIAIVNKEVQGTDLGYGLETERSIDLVISGQLEGVEFARVRTLVLLDELNGLTSTTCEINQKFHNIIGGRKRTVIQTIQEQTSTSIYFPLPLASNVGQHDPNDPTLAARQNTVHITGDFFGVQRARDMLFQVFAHKSKCTISRDTALLPRKIDWMLSDRLEDLRQIMIDNGTFIDLPALGGQSTRVSVFGDNRVNIERSIRTMMALACQFYVASLWLLPMAYNALASPTTLNATQVTPLLKTVANESGAEIVFKTNSFEIHGVETEVKDAVGMILDMDLVKQFNFEVRFQIELAASEREFLQGRKCGKVNKIMKQCGVRIKFETFNDYNFLIELSCNDKAAALQGLALLQEELPAEVSFHVPEAYHKRCIGVGGKQIQKVMKRYGVYVKFSNAEEFASLGGYLDNEDNVIAKTPAKNAINLEHLKQSVMEMVNPKDKDYTTETVTISRRYHRSLLGEKGIFIHDIENKCSSKVIFPPRETCSDLVSIFGPESQIHIASAMLLEHVPFEAEFRAPSAPNLQQVLGSQEFVALTERVKRDLSITIVTGPIPAGATEAVFKLRLSRSNSDFLPTAKDLLEDFLVSRNVNVYAAPARARSDSFASSFPHFATKLISTPAAEVSEANFQAELSNRFNDGGRLRTAASSPALKALFDSPAASAGPLRSNHNSQNFGPPGSIPGTNASPMVGSSLYSSPYGDTMPGGVSSDVWGSTPRQATTPGSGGPPGSSSGIAFPQHTTRQSEDVGIFARGQEVFGVDERMRQLRKPRSLAYRAQSLDMSNVGSQQAALDATLFAGGPVGGYGGFGSGHGAGGSSGPGTPFNAYPSGSGGGNYGWGPSPSMFGSGASSSNPFGGNAGGGGPGGPGPSSYTHHYASQSTGGHFPSPAMSRMAHSSSSSAGIPPSHRHPSNLQQQQGDGTPSVEEMSRILGGISFNPTH
ncbi:unnamed protein product [Sympodiomycopsis kandeliae]